MTASFPTARRPRKAYLTARKRLVDLLSSPEFNPGDQIPSERELADLLAISRMTVRKIIAELIAQNRLQRRGNRGTWLVNSVIERPLIPMQERGMAKIVELNGAAPSSQLIYFRVSAASTRIAARLAIRAGDAVIMIKRLRLADGAPVCVETSYLPQCRMPDLTAARLEQSGSLYQFLAQHYQIIAATDEGTIQVESMAEEEQVLLAAAPESPALVYRGVIYDKQQSPVEYLVSVNHPQRVTFRISSVMTG